MDLNNFKNKYLNYKKKYNFLKNQYAGAITDETKTYIINSIFYRWSLKFKHSDELKLFDLLFKQLNLNIETCECIAYPPDTIEFKVCALKDKMTDKGAEEIMTSFRRNIGEGDYGMVFAGNLGDSKENSVIKKPQINELIKPLEQFKKNLRLIIEAYINVCLINKYIKEHQNNNLVFSIYIWSIVY